MSVSAAFLDPPFELLEIYSFRVFRKEFFPGITAAMRLEEIETRVTASLNVVFFFSGVTLRLLFPDVKI